MKKRNIILLLITLIFIILGYTHIRSPRYENYDIINIVVSQRVIRPNFENKQVGFDNFEYEINIAPPVTGKIVMHNENYNKAPHSTDFSYEEFEKIWHKMTKAETVLLLDYMFLNNIEGDIQSKTRSVSNKKVWYSLDYISSEHAPSNKYNQVRITGSDFFLISLYHIVALLCFIHKYFVFIIILILIFIGTHVLKKRSQLQVPHKH